MGDINRQVLQLQLAVLQCVSPWDVQESSSISTITPLQAPERIHGSSRQRPGGGVTAGWELMGKHTSLRAAPTRDIVLELNSSNSSLL
jgi:hypothetical protein